MIAEKLRKFGFNLFSTRQVSKLPNDILDIFRSENILFKKEDTLCLIGSGGKSLWKHLPHPLKSSENPIENFSKDQFKKHFSNLQILFPHPTLLFPLQRIGRLLNLGSPSLLGQDINSEFGLWFAYRGLVLTKDIISHNELPTFISPCESCPTKPCISSCPSGAIRLGENNFTMNLCAQYRLKEESSCADRCLARISCPYQNEHQYKIEQTQYHMTNTSHKLMLSNYK